MRATDSSTASATVNVIVRVTDVNEAPFASSDDVPTVLRVTENDDPPVHHAFEDGEDPVDARYLRRYRSGRLMTPTLDLCGDSVDGVDRDVLTFNGDDALIFMENHEPDFEKKDSYSITVVARSGAGLPKADRHAGRDHRGDRRG